LRNFSVEQDARAKAQQYSHDAHARLEEERIAAVRRGQALESEKASFEVMADELDSALAALRYEPDVLTSSIIGLFYMSLLLYVGLF